jgi:carbamoylphosphate synthase large subunit
VESVDEVMSIGMSFEEAFQQGLRMADEDVTGFDPDSTTITDDVILIKDYLEIFLYFTIGIKYSK